MKSLEALAKEAKDHGSDGGQIKCRRQPHPAQALWHMETYATTLPTRAGGAGGGLLNADEGRNNMFVVTVARQGDGSAIQDLGGS